MAVTIERAFPRTGQPLQKEQLHLASYPYTPDRDAICKKAATIFLGIFHCFSISFWNSLITESNPLGCTVFLGRDLIGNSKISNIDEHERPLIVGAI